MYLDCVVPIPVVPGKINTTTKGNTTYVRYVARRIYHPDRRYNVPEQKIIGKVSEQDSSMMIPNENFLMYFGETEIPETRKNKTKSSCIRIGAYLVIKKIMEEYALRRILAGYFNEKECGMFLDLVAYSIISENNAAQYYPDYVYNHPLFTDKMRMYSDSKISEFLSSITDEQSIGFLNEWNAQREHKEKIYISYDSTNKSCQAGDIEMAEFGHSKNSKDLPLFNYAISYDTYNREPLFYEQYSGSIVDVSQLRYMISKAYGYGYRNVGFILDRGYFSKENIRYMDSCRYDFVIMVKGMASFVKDLICKHKGEFENDRDCKINEYNVYGMTKRKKMYETDTKERYFHIFYSSQKAYFEREQTEEKIARMTAYLKKQEGRSVTIAKAYGQYFHIETDPKGDVFLFAKEKKKIIEKEISLCGYFVIVTSAKMTYAEALDLYKSRDASEKLFRGDKSYLGNKSLRVHNSDSAEAKIFVEFVALIVRNKIYTSLKDEIRRIEKRPNYMTVPAALKELEKIEMIRQPDNKYRLDHSVTATQKNILAAFDISAAYVKNKSTEINEAMHSNDEIQAKKKRKP